MFGKVAMVGGILASLWVSGCASQIMAGYVGKPVTEAVMDYGPPTNAIDLGEGKRAFQWARRRFGQTPMVASTSMNGVGSPWVTSNTVITGGQTIVSECLYTLTTTWDAPGRRWMVDGYRQPRVMCE